MYESRLELARLLFADFDRSVTRIVAQPFALVAQVEGRRHTQIPDFVLITEDGPIVVDCCPSLTLQMKPSLGLPTTRDVDRVAGDAIVGMVT
ncbi:hypothetical protein ACHIPZ_11120, partial [Antrihabitans sp. NCIMB 15449]